MATPSEALVAAVVQRIEAALPALVAAAGLPPITEVLDYDPALPQAARAPQVWVDLPSDRRSGAPGRGATLHHYAHQTTVLVAVSAAGQEPSAAARNLRQYADLIRECLEGDQALSGTALWVQWQSTEFTPNLARGTSLFQIAYLTFDVNRRTRATT